MYLFEELTTHLDNNLITIGAFIDLRKAFDTIGQPILINKLCHHILRGSASSWDTNVLQIELYMLKIIMRVQVTNTFYVAFHRDTFWDQTYSY